MPCHNYIEKPRLTEFIKDGTEHAVFTWKPESILVISAPFRLAETQRVRGSAVITVLRPQVRGSGEGVLCTRDEMKHSVGAPRSLTPALFPAQSAERFRGRMGDTSE
ncbi:hypothetical protein MATL_G00141040 [Megalops atlanticus]|uniref:Uncharacterized protein n=1 Tax=Megalops atlanticus TaxID=7932 RepID=A0A9D3PY14_MEGAT|nr:hypothetical protein MATL_G00141040 [Megalops atlanticus]